MPLAGPHMHFCQRIMLRQNISRHELFWCRPQSQLVHVAERKVRDLREGDHAALDAHHRHESSGLNSGLNSGFNPGFNSGLNSGFNPGLNPRFNSGFNWFGSCNVPDARERNH